MAHQIAKFANNVSSAILINRDVIHIIQIHSCLTQAITNRLHRKASPMLDTAKALLLGRSNERTVPQKCRRRICVERVESEDNQVDFSLSEACRDSRPPVSVTHRSGAAYPQGP